MRNMLCLALLLPAVLLAAGKTQPTTMVAPDNGAPSQIQSPVDLGRPSVPPRALVGTIDTIGGTTYDWQANGPIYRFVKCSPGFGMHVTWMYSAETSGTSFTDRNMRYNYYDFTSHTWNWIDADPMQSGVNTFTHRSGYGALDAASNGMAVIDCHYTGTSGVTPKVARDVAPGAGIFEYADGDATFGANQWPPLGVNEDGTIHIFPMTSAYVQTYGRLLSPNWPNFEPPVTPIDPSPGFPTHNVAASKMSGKVCLTWEMSGNVPEDAYVQTSNDFGATWNPAENIIPPVAFGNGSDTVTSFHITSIFPYYDKQDRLNLVANLMPFVNDTGYIIPAQIWHYCPDNAPQWNRVHIATCDPANLQAPVGYNAIYACRPSMGEDSKGNLYVTWEQFDSANVEPTTTVLRADIFAAASEDHGLTWKPAVKLTDAGTNSMRFPSCIDWAIPGNPETVAVRYEIDQIAGMYVQGVGAVSLNMVVLQKFPITDLGVGVAEPGQATAPKRLELSATPNPASGRTVISYAVPRSGDVSLVVYDAAGRPVQTLAQGRCNAGRYSAALNAEGLANGVYFYTLISGESSLSRKLILAH